MCKAVQEQVSTCEGVEHALACTRMHLQGCARVCKGLQWHARVNEDVQVHVRPWESVRGYARMHENL